MLALMQILFHQYSKLISIFPCLVGCLMKHESKINDWKCHILRSVVCHVVTILLNGFNILILEYWKNVTEEYPTLLEKGKYKARLIISNHCVTATKPVSVSSDLQDLLSSTTTLPQAIFNYFNLKERANYIIKLGLGILQGCKQSVHPRLPSLINLEGNFFL